MPALVAVTGMGMVTPVGSSIESFRLSVWEGRSAVQRVDGKRFDVHGPWLAAPVEDFRPTDWVSAREARRLDRAAQMSVAAVHQALGDAHLLPEDPDRETGVEIGLALGTAFGTAHTIQRTYFDFFSKQSKSVHAVPGCMPHSAVAACGIRYRLTGPSFTVSTACSSGAVAIGLGFELVRNGLGSPIVVGGCDATLTSVHLENWRSMKVLAKPNGDPGRAIRPFSKDREGFALGEGAVVVVLEEMEAAVRRGATIYAEVLGYGFSSDATHLAAFRNGPSEGSSPCSCLSAAPARGGGLRQRPRHGNAAQR